MEPDGVRELLGPPPQPPAVDAALALVRRRLFGGDIKATIDRYELGRVLGAGGVGLIYEARDPMLDRKVALKVLQDRRGRNEQQRLIREARALAKLSHPNIVAIYDVGLSESGDVYIVMEHIDGEPLSVALKDETSWRGRLQPYLDAAAGLAAAHAIGLVHRDFKPGNVMLGHDGRVRVLDFGLAAVFDSPSARGSTEVDSGVVVDVGPQTQHAVCGTPPYMSPEQHRGEALTPASDQFNFAVAVWEALHGERPFAGPDLDALYEAKCNGPPRGVPPELVPSRVDAALRRALAPSAADRFPSMDALREAMAPPSSRRALPIIGLAALGIIVPVAFGWTSSDAGAPCKGAAEQLRPTWNPTRRDAVGRALEAASGSFGKDSWQRVAPELDAYAAQWASIHTEACQAAQKGDRESATALDLSMACLRRARSQLEATVGVLEQADPETTTKLHQLVTALPELSRCSDIEALRSAPPPPEEHAAEVEALFAELDEVRARRDAGRMPNLIAQTADILARAEALDYTPLTVDALSLRGSSLETAGNYEAAGEVLQRAFSIASAADDARGAATAAMMLVGVMHRLADVEAARDWATRALAFVERSGEPENALGVWNNLGNVSVLAGDYDRAIEEFGRARDIAVEQFGAEDPRVANLLDNLGAALMANGDHTEALEVLERALRIHRATLGDDHLEVGRGLANLGSVRARLDDRPEALRVYAESIDILKRRLGDRHPHVASLHHNMAEAHRYIQQYDEAEAHYRAALKIRSEGLGPDHPDTARTEAGLAKVELARGQPEAAARRLARALDTIEVALGSDHPVLGEVERFLGSALRKAGDPAAAIGHFRHALQLHQQHATRLVVGATRLELAQSLAAVDQDAEAQTLAEQALADFEAEGHGTDEVTALLETLADKPR